LGYYHYVVRISSGGIWIDNVLLLRMHIGMKKRNRTKAYKAVGICLFVAFIVWLAVLDRLTQISAIRSEINNISQKIRQQNNRGDSAIYSVGAPVTPPTPSKSLIVDNGLE
jgi:hypothetical protein